MSLNLFETQNGAIKWNSVKRCQNGPGGKHHVNDLTRSGKYLTTPRGGVGIQKIDLTFSRGGCLLENPYTIQVF